MSAGNAESKERVGCAGPYFLRAEASIDIE